MWGCGVCGDLLLGVCGVIAFVGCFILCGVGGYACDCVWWFVVFMSVC